MDGPNTTAGQSVANATHAPHAFHAPPAPHGADERPRCLTCHSFYPRLGKAGEASGEAPGKPLSIGDCRVGHKQVVLIDKAPKSFWPVVSAEEGCPNHSAFSSYTSRGKKDERIANITLDPNYPRYGHNCPCVYIGKAKDKVENNKILRYHHFTRPDGGTLSFVIDCPMCGGTGKPRVPEGAGDGTGVLGDPDARGGRDYAIPPKPSGPIADRPTGDDLIDGAAELASMTRGK